MLPHELEQLWQEIQLAFDEGTFASPEAQAKINRFMEEGPDAPSCIVTGKQIGRAHV